MTSRVAIQKCEDYDKERVFASVHTLLDHFGGIQRFVKKGQNVLLKPNMLSAKVPERGITTHPVMVEAMIREVHSVGGTVWMGDSPAGAVKGIQRYWDNTGYGELAGRTGIKLINFEADDKVPRHIGGMTFQVARAVAEADVVINLPKFKTHGLTLYTGAIKNLLGTLPGFQKVHLHKQYPHPTSFSRMLVEIYSLVKPQLNVMDGILGMGGNGPSTGQRRMTSLLLASTDGIALDAVAGRLMGFREGEVDVVRIGNQENVGTGKLDEIEILGEPLDSIHLEDFNLPSNRLIRMIPEFLGRWVGKLLWVRPYADLEKCTGCGICAENCPVEAIRMVDGIPVTDYKLCINCLCCNECCPESAVIQQMSWLAKLFA